jgi:hypothetical protein
MPWVYSLIAVFIGLFFYWLRSHHRAWYGLSEMIVAFALMYVVYFPHGGPSLLAGGGSVPSFFGCSNEPSGDFLWQRLCVRSRV